MIWQWLSKIRLNLTRKQTVIILTTFTTGAVMAEKQFGSDVKGEENSTDDKLKEDRQPLQYHRLWGFTNPFREWRQPGLGTLAHWKLWYRDETNLPNDLEELNKTLPIETPKFDNNSSGVHVTWIGHATTFVQLDGINILTDPIFSDVAGPPGVLSLAGHKRYRPPGCKVEHLPQVNVVLISHSHYDHLDVQSVKDLHKKFGDTIHWFVPMNLKSWFEQCGCQNVHELNWWQEKDMPGFPKVKVAFTPAQHWSGRKLRDTNKTLWGSWCVIGPRHRFYFAGDTGYCPAFKQIGEEYGPFDLAAIPIGAYLPRVIMEPQHVDPAQAVLIHQDIKARKSLGIHWGTFAMAYEPYLKPPEDLKKALENAGIPKEDFFVLKHGETKTL